MLVFDIDVIYVEFFIVDGPLFGSFDDSVESINIVFEFAVGVGFSERFELASLGSIAAHREYEVA